MSDSTAIPCLALEVSELLQRQGLTLGLAESATGGLISSWLTGLSGSSVCFRGAVVAYDNRIKVRLLGVSPESLARHGAVSPSVAEEMARGARERLETDLALSDTGIAGPSGATPSKPVGLFYVALASEGATVVEKHSFAGDRLSIRVQASIAALDLLRRRLLAPSG